MQKLVFMLLATAAIGLGPGAVAQSLKGSAASMTRQNEEAVRYGYSFLENAQAVTQFVDRGHLGNLLGIASFMAYGLLCTAVGYFAPAPPRAASPDRIVEAS